MSRRNCKLQESNLMFEVSFEENTAKGLYGKRGGPITHSKVLTQEG